MDEAEVLVADSWVVVGGRVLAPADHVQRFVTGVCRQGGDPRVARLEVTAALQHPGDSWSRIDLLADHTLRSLRRPIPPTWTQATLWTAPDDPRTDPWTKGPDLLRLGRLRQRAREFGADEAVVLDRGRVCEGAHSALVWWRDGVLHHVDDRLPRVWSVTEAWVRRTALAHGVTVVAAEVSPEGLAGAEVWLLSALHGICPVVAWVDGPDLADPSPEESWSAGSWRAGSWRAAGWQAQLAEARESPDSLHG